MTLIFTIFILVFLTELISWIGKSVLLELVSPHVFSTVVAGLPNLDTLIGIWAVSSYFLRCEG